MIRDLSGVPIPSRRRGNTAAGVDRVVAIPPIRDAPNEDAVEFLFSAYATLAAGGAAFVSLTDPQTGANFAQQVPPLSKGRLDSVIVWCPDMVAAAAPYLTAQLMLDGQPAPAWGFVPVYPRSGVASLSFDAEMDLPPGGILGLNGRNTDAVSTHLLVVYLHGWFWSKDLVEG